MRYVTGCISQLEELGLDTEDMMSVDEFRLRKISDLRMEPLIIDGLFTLPINSAVPFFSFVLALCCIFSIHLP